MWPTVFNSPSLISHAVVIGQPPTVAGQHKVHVRCTPATRNALHRRRSCLCLQERMVGTADSAVEISEYKPIPNWLLAAGGVPIQGSYKCCFILPQTLSPGMY